MPVYVLDTSVWIHMGRHHPPDIFANMWEQVDQAISAGTIRSPEEVLRELERGTDELATLLSGKSGLFIPLDEAQSLAVQHVLEVCPTLADAQGERNRADPFVVGTARLINAEVVTRERPRSGTAGRMKIPDACDILGVPWIDWFGFLRDMQWGL